MKMKLISSLMAALLGLFGTGAAVQGVSVHQYCNVPGCVISGEHTHHYCDVEGCRINGEQTHQ